MLSKLSLTHCICLKINCTPIDSQTSLELSVFVVFMHEIKSKIYFCLNKSLFSVNILCCNIHTKYLVTLLHSLVNIT